MPYTYDIGYEVGNLVISLLCLIYVIRRRKARWDTQHKIFILLFVVAILASATDIISVAIEVLYFGRGKRELGYAASTLYFLFRIQIPPLFTYYISWINSSILARKKWFRYCFWIPTSVESVLLFANLRTRYIFSYEQGFYQRNHFGILILISDLYLIYCLYNVIRYRRVTPKQTRITVFSAVLLYLTGEILQSVYAGWLVEMLCLSLGLLLILYFIECDETRVDQVALFHNEKALTIRARQLFYMKSRWRTICVHLTNIRFYFSIMSIDEGQQLRKQIADWIAMNLSIHNVLTYVIDDNKIVFIVADDSEKSEKKLIDKLLEKAHGTWKAGRFRINLQAVIYTFHLPEDFSGTEDLLNVLRMENEIPHGSVTILNEKQIAGLKRTMDINQCITRILENDSVEVYYQPIWDSRTNRICACEALMRVNDEELGFVPPNVIVPIAERNGRIASIDQMVFNKVCRFLHDRRPEQYGLDYVEINLSLYEMLTPGLISYMRTSMEKYGVPVERINIEFTETLSDDFSDMFQYTKKQLHEAGFRFSLDDFGTEYSNVRRLFDNEFTNIKIDKSLLWDADRNESSRRLLTDMIRMLRQMGFNVLQEGVETKEQLDFVVSEGCNLIQGYYFSKPVPEDQFIEYLKNFNSGSGAGGAADEKKADGA